MGPTITRSGRRLSKATSYKESSASSEDAEDHDLSDSSEEVDDEESDSDGRDRLGRKQNLIRSGQKRRRSTKVSTSKKKVASVPKKASSTLTPRKKDPKEISDDDDDEGWEAGTQRVVTTLVSAPKSGHVPAGQISPNTLDFLRQLCEPENNDREWFAAHDPVYRYAWKNFCDFSEALLNDIMEQVDDTVPWLPVKDLTYRIYRDIRFSNDKTPYKTNFMSTFSRGGRKGPFAGYHVMVAPSRSFFAAGRWQPEKADLSVIRRHILDGTDEAKELKRVISSPSFKKIFGPPERDGLGRGKRCNLWGGGDDLKVAPKIEGVDKNHKDIELLKLRSFCVICHFDDKEVLKASFRQRLIEIALVARPLVHVLNEMTSPSPPPPPESIDGAEEGAESN